MCKFSYEDEDGKYTTTGGRVLSIIVFGNNFTQCFKRAYDLCKDIIYKNKYYRRDIGLQYIIGDNVDNRNNHWDNYNIMNVPTVALFQSNRDSTYDIKTLVILLNMHCKNRKKGLVKIGLLVCNRIDAKLMEMSELYEIPIIYLNNP